MFKVLLISCIFSYSFIFSLKHVDAKTFSEYDILGIKLGMSPEEVAEIAHSQGYELKEENRVENEDSKEHLYQYWTSDDSQGNLLLHYALPPSNKEVLIVKRGTSEHFFHGQYLQEALVEKYGEPTHLREPSQLFDGSATLYMWYHGSADDGPVCPNIPPPGSKEQINFYAITHNDCTGLLLRIYLETRLAPDGPSFHIYESHLVDYSAVLVNYQEFLNAREDAETPPNNEVYVPMEPPKL
ncbi:hypothetical protein [Billgrantia kenyensis]|uniref:Uncharacterized protein n=1 Tax=Billgrantia kenyensis TaxID=321266 RepID=A0A7W0AFI0_9GAMM|nr:hypothetical protein [Halomonas kenyensis]MBA2781208.1 hypothetical protein [Halomonas kenyensis]MCG6663890.1 hypothetical protein [Halomonas kenyensis]